MVIKKVFWVLFVLLAALMGIYPFIFYVLKIPFGIMTVKPALTLVKIEWRIPFHVHIVMGAIAILTGWVQFIRKWREGNLKFHRMIGFVYLASVVVSGMAGIVISFDANGGTSAFLALFLASFLWVTITLMAYYFVLQRKINLHRKLMVYSYAFTFAGVTLRLWLPTLATALGDFDRAYDFATWLAWLVNLAVAMFINEKGKVDSKEIKRKEH